MIICYQTTETMELLQLLLKKYRHNKFSVSVIASTIDDCKKISSWLWTHSAQHCIPHGVCDDELSNFVDKQNVFIDIKPRFKDVVIIIGDFVNNDLNGFNKIVYINCSKKMDNAKNYVFENSNWREI